MSRCAVFIDGGYLNKVLENEFARAAIDYGKLSEEVAQGTERLRTYYYHCMPYQSNPPTEEEKRRYVAMAKFVDALKRLPRFEFRQGKLAKRDSGFEQKRVDIWIAVDLVRLSFSHQIAKAVLVTGDSDLVPAIESAKDAGVVVQLYFSRRSVHQELLQACDERYEIGQALIDRIRR
ncbi:MAG: NYN domain-containing protein [Acidobacteriia bacterium]|nr:NYN domain-containing protein [Terriglobia bacterium]